MAEVVPYIDIAVSLVGCLGSPALTLYVPPLLDIVRKYKDLNGWYKLIIAKDMIIVALGIFLFIIGMYESAKQIRNINRAP